MSLLHSLPHELLLLISNEFTPADVVSFSLTCKHFHLFLDPNLSIHRSRLQEWSKIKISHCCHKGEHRHLPDCDSAFTLLRCLQENPWLEYYIRSLKYDYDNVSHDRYHGVDVTRDVLGDQLAATTPRELDIIRSQFASDISAENEFGKWCQELRLGSEDAACLTVLALLPNLTRLNLITGYKFLQRMDKLLLIVDRATPRPFQNLRSLHIEKSLDSEILSVALGELSRVIFFTVTEKLTGYCIFAVSDWMSSTIFDMKNDIPILYGRSTSALEVVDFTESCITPRNLAKFIKVMPCLRRFRYRVSYFHLLEMDYDRDLRVPDDFVTHVPRWFYERNPNMEEPKIIDFLSKIAAYLGTMGLYITITAKWKNVLEISRREEGSLPFDKNYTLELSEDDHSDYDVAESE